MPDAYAGSEDDKIFAMGVNLIFCFGVVLSFFMPYNFIILVPLYAVPLAGIFYGTAGTLLRQHSVRVFWFSILFTIVYPAMFLWAQMIVTAEFGEQPRIAEWTFDMVMFGEEHNLMAVTFAAARLFNETSRQFLAIDIVVYALALLQLALFLQTFVWPLYNAARAFRQDFAEYPWIIK